jgi:type I restriction-modification system DNA methylase subunit
VPQDARWTHLQAHAKQPTIGKTVDEAMDTIEKGNTSLKGVLPKVYARQNLDPTSLGELIDLISNIALGDAQSRSADVLGHVFEYFLGEFALVEGKKGGQFYTPRSVVELLVEMLEPYKGRVLDPCCGSGGMFVQSEKFVTEHQGKINDISIYGQESNQTTWRLAKMNLAIRGIDSSQVKWNNEGSFLNDAHKDLKADYIIANPPFNVSDWSGDLLCKDGRWQYGTPPTGNANYARCPILRASINKISLVRLRSFEPLERAPLARLRLKNQREAGIWVLRNNLKPITSSLTRRLMSATGAVIYCAKMDAGNMVHRPWAMPTTRGYSTSSITSPPADRQALYWQKGR